MGGPRRGVVRPTLVLLGLVLLLAGCTSGGGRDNPRPVGSSGTNPQSGSRPNVVFILTDDLSSDLVRYMPAVRQMQRTGTSFDDYFVVNSLCCPSRAAIFTGQYPHNNGVLDNNTFPDGGYDTFHGRNLEQQTFAKSLQDSGYRTGLVGKYLNGYDPDDGQPDGWDYWVSGDAYKGFDYTENENGQQVKYGNLPQDYFTDVASARAATFLDESSRDDKPFFLEVATFAPHMPYTPAPRDRDRFPGVTAPRTPAFDVPPRNPPDWLQSKGRLSASQVSNIDRDYRKRVRSVQAVSDLILNLRTVLRQRGELDNTYFVFSSDNGYHMGEHTLLPGKQLAYDTDIRVPLIVTGPGVPAGRTVDAMASSVDLAPTFEAIGDADASGPRDGVSLLPLWHGEPPPADWQQAVLVEHKGHATPPGDPDHQPRRSGFPSSYHAVRTKDVTYVEYSTGARELYDRSTDPYELDNVYGSTPESVRQLYATQLHALMACSGASECQRVAR